MGRTTPSLRAVVYNYASRLSKVSEILPPSEKQLFDCYLEDIDFTLSLCMHVGVADPIEVFLVHLIRKLNRLSRGCKE